MKITIPDWRHAYLTTLYQGRSLIRLFNVILWNFSVEVAGILETPNTELAITQPRLEMYTAWMQS